MNSDISIPKPVLKSAEQLARKLGMSFSELCTAALSAYVQTHEKDSVTEALNRLYETTPSSIDRELVKMQVTSIGDEQWA
jgi:predicted nucleotidyltransferase